MVSRSSKNSTSSLETSTSVILCARRTIFSRLSLMRAYQEVSAFGYPRRVADRRFRACRKGSQPRNLETQSAARQGSTQHQLAVARQLPLHLFVHLLIGSAGAPHFVLVLHQNLAHFVVQAVLDGQLFHHALAHALRQRFRRFAFNLIAFDQPLHHFRCHVTDIIPNQKHSNGVLCPPTLSDYKEKQFTGCPAKVQLAR